MKKYLFLIVLFVALPLVAYQAGQAGRANFGSAAQQQPANNGYRAFTNSNNQWRQGVQTQTVQTSRAGASATEFEPVEKKAPVGKKAVAAAPAAANKPAAAPAVAPTQPSTGTVAMPANADPTAMLQQVQGMMQGMQGMMGAANGQQPAAAGQTAMPDLSALMGGMIPAAPAAAPAPAKK